MALTSLWRRTRPFDRVVVLLLFILCAVLFVVLRPGPPGRRVVVEAAGRVVFTAPLDQDRSFIVTGPLGETRLAIRHGSVCIEASPCPHRVCLGMGAITRSGEILACVPNGVLVRITGTASTGDRTEPYDLLSR